MLAVDDRRVEVETGYGLEGFITDGFAGETMRSVTPFFREAEYGRGLLAGATRLAERIAEGRNVDLNLAPPPQARSGRRRNSGGFPVGLLGDHADHLSQHDEGRTRPAAPLDQRRGSVRRRLWRRIGGGGWSSGGGFGGGFGGFGGGRSGGGGGGAGW